MHGKKKLLAMCNELGIEMEETATYNDMVAILTEMGTVKEDLLRKPSPETMMIRRTTRWVARNGGRDLRKDGQKERQRLT